MPISWKYATFSDAVTVTDNRLPAKVLLTLAVFCLAGPPIGALFVAFTLCAYTAMDAGSLWLVFYVLPMTGFMLVVCYLAGGVQALVTAIACSAWVVAKRPPTPPPWWLAVIVAVSVQVLLEVQYVRGLEPPSAPNTVMTVAMLIASVGAACSCALLLKNKWPEPKGAE